jgi:hypothetical protein
VVLDVLGEWFVELAGIGANLTVGNVHHDPRFRQAGEPASGDQRVGIGHRADHALDAGLEHRIRTGASAAGVTAGFEIEIERSALRASTRSFQRQDLAVLLVRVRVEALASDDSSFVDNDSANAWIRRSQRNPQPREFECPPQILFVLVVDGDEVLLGEQSGNEGLRIKWQQVSNLLAHADVAHRQS